MVMEFLNMLLRIPRRGWRAIRFLTVNNVDLLVSMISASSMFKGRKSDIVDFFPAPFTRKLRRPYSLLRVWTTSEFSPNLVVWRTMSSAFWVILFGLKILRFAQDDRKKRMTGYHARSFSHSAIARRALPLWEMAFFSSSEMSARVSPGNSSAMKIGS